MRAGVTQEPVRYAHVPTAPALPRLSAGSRPLPAPGPAYAEEPGASAAENATGGGGVHASAAHPRPAAHGSNGHAGPVYATPGSEVNDDYDGMTGSTAVVVASPPTSHRALLRAAAAAPPTATEATRHRRPPGRGWGRGPGAGAQRCGWRVTLC